MRVNIIIPFGLAVLFLVEFQNPPLSWLSVRSAYKVGQLSLRPFPASRCQREFLGHPTDIKSDQ
jgi:hypothetical protein